MEILTSDIYNDTRGYLGITDIDFSVKQINLSHSKQNVLRGLHYQYNKPLNKLVTLLEGKMEFIILNLYNGKIETKVIDKIGTLILVPYGYAAGFLVLSESLTIQYLYDEHYNPNGEDTISPYGLGIDSHFPTKVIRSDRDCNAQSFFKWKETDKAKIFKEII